MLRVQVQAVEGVVGQQQAAIQIDPVGQRRHDRRPGDPDRRLLHAAEERPEAQLACALQHPFRRTDPAALRELDVDAGDDADKAIEILVGES